MIYLDNQTTTQPSEVAVRAMERYLTRDWGLATAPHAWGQRLHGPMLEMVGEVYALLGARDSDTFVFTSSGAEATEQVIRTAYVEMARAAGRNHFITSNVDEAPTILGFERLLELGCEMSLAPVNSGGVLTPEALAESLTPRTGLVSLSWANGLTGVVQPVAELAELCRERGIWLHLDATHVLGKLNFDLDEIAPDFMSFNGDQLHAPQGTGGLWVRSGLHPLPLIGGRGVPMALVAALAAAAREAREGRDRFALEVAMLRQRLEAGLGNVLFSDSERLPHVTSVAFPGVASDTLLYALDQRQLYASFGGGNFQQLTLQLEACGISRPLADCTLSFGLSRFTSADEVDRAIAIIQETVRSLQKLSEEVWVG